jgi:uncharacterized protein YbaP (TraB family)
MKKKMMTSLLALLAVPSAAMAETAPAPAKAAAPAAAAALPDADPAIWRVKDADTTIYLFGTVHALDGKKDWFNDEVKAAYDRSKEVVFEILLPEPAKAQATVMEKAVDKSGKTLTSRLTPKQAKVLAAELQSMGAPANALDQFEPWFAATQLAMIRYAKKGYTPDKGAEMILKAAAKKDGKPTGEVETFDWQMNLFDTMPADLQLKMLTSYLDDIEKGDQMIDDMMGSWASGDIDKLASLMNEAMIETPELGKILLADRNARWAEWIKARMAKPGTVFMAVGAGHLGGKDSVQDYLAKKGLKAERVKS